MTKQEERYIHCTRTQCTDASPVEGKKGVICPIDQRYHQFRQRCIYNVTYEDVAKAAKKHYSKSSILRLSEGAQGVWEQIIDSARSSRKCTKDPIIAMAEVHGRRVGKQPPYSTRLCR